MDHPNALAYFKVAQVKYTTNDVEVDIPPTEELAEKLLSRNDIGAWVRAWVFVSDEEA